jgi:hypothetical protein
MRRPSAPRALPYAGGAAASLSAATLLAFLGVASVVSFSDWPQGLAAERGSVYVPAAPPGTDEGAKQDGSELGLSGPGVFRLSGLASFGASDGGAGPSEGDGGGGAGGNGGPGGGGGAPSAPQGTEPNGPTPPDAPPSGGSSPAQSGSGPPGQSGSSPPGQSGSSPGQSGGGSAAAKPPKPPHGTAVTPVGPSGGPPAHAGGPHGAPPGQLKK